MKRTKARIWICFLFAVWALCLLPFLPDLINNSVAASNPDDETVPVSEPILVGLNGSFNVVSRPYDGTTRVAVSLAGGSSLYDMNTSQALTIPVSEGNVANANAGSNKTVTVNLGSNYTLASQFAPTITISQRSISITEIIVAEKTFNNSNSATVTGAKFRDALMMEDLSTVLPSAIPVYGSDYTINAAFDSPNVFLNSNGTIGVQSVSIVGTISWNSANLTLTNNTTSALASVKGLQRINPRPISISGVNVVQKEFDGRNTAEITNITWGGLDLLPSPAMNSLNIAAVFDSIDVGDRIVTITNASFKTTGPDAATNYTLNESWRTFKGSGSISKRTILLDTITVNSKIYDGTDTATLINIAGNTGVTFKDGTGDALVLPSGAPTRNTIDITLRFDQGRINVGNDLTVKIFSVSAKADSNFIIGGNSSSWPTAKADITKRNISLGKIHAQSRPYDGTDTATITRIEFANPGIDEGLLPVLGVDFSIVNARFVDANAGVNKVVTYDRVDWGSTVCASNFTLGTSSPTGSAEITPISIALDSIEVDDKPFDGTNIATLKKITFSRSGLPATVTQELLPTIGDVIASATFWNSNAGDNIQVNIASIIMNTSVKGANFKLTEYRPTAIAKIVPRETWLLAIHAENKAYDGTGIAKIDSVSFANMGASVGMAAVASGYDLKLSQINIAATFKQADVGSNLEVTVSGVQMLTSNFVFRNDWGVNVKTTANITQRPFSVTAITAKERPYDGTSIVQVNTATLSGLNGLPEELIPRLGRDFQINGTIDSPNAGQRTVTLESNSLIMLAASEIGRNFKFEPAIISPTTTVTITRGERTDYTLPELRMIYREGITLANFELFSPWQWHGQPNIESFLPGIYDVQLFIAGDSNVFDLIKTVQIQIVHCAPTVKVSGSRVSWNNMPNNAGYGVFVDGELVFTTEANVTQFDLSTLGINASGKKVQVRVFGQNDSLHSDLSAVPPPNRTFLIIIIVLLVCAGLGAGGFFGFRYFKKAKLERGQKIKWDDVDENYDMKQSGDYVNQFLRGRTMPVPTKQLPFPTHLPRESPASQPVRTFSTPPSAAISTAQQIPSGAGVAPVPRPTYPTPSVGTASSSTQQIPPKPVAPIPSSSPPPPKPSYPPPTPHPAAGSSPSTAQHSATAPMSPRPTYPPPTPRPAGAPLPPSSRPSYPPPTPPSAAGTPPSSAPRSATAPMPPRPTYPSPTPHTDTSSSAASHSTNAPIPPRPTYPSPTPRPVGTPQTPPSSPSTSSSGHWFD